MLKIIIINIFINILKLYLYLIIIYTLVIIALNLIKYTFQIKISSLFKISNKTINKIK